MVRNSSYFTSHSLQTIVANVIKLIEKKDETDNDDLESKRTKDIPLSTLNFIIPLGPLINMFCIYQLSPIPFILSNGDDDTDKENEHLEIVY
nr:12887_t:CDS:2 [Entrophospora candida]